MNHILSPEISIAVIAKNEEDNIGKVLSDILTVIEQGKIESCEEFLIDGCSEDNTVGIAKKFGINIFKVEGAKGVSIKKALEVAGGKYILFIDADNSHVPEDIPRLLRAIKENDCDLVIVSRILGKSEELGMKSLDSFLRLLGNRMSTFMVNLRWGVKLTDIQNGFRIIKRSAALELNLEECGFAIEQEMVMKCLKKNKKILEIPGVERKRLFGSSKICKRKEFWKYLWALLKNF